MTGASPESAMVNGLGNGNVAILYDGSWQYQRWLRSDPEDTEVNIGFTLFPMADDQPPFAVGGIGNSWFMGARTEHPELAWHFIESFNSRENHVALNLQDPHIPARTDAAADPAFQETPFLRAMVESSSALLLTDPEPTFRELIVVVQNATGVVATGEATPEEAISRYASELTRILGEDGVVAEPCP
jgi:multiple sugar transport system substrate-binding protein